MMMRKLNGVRKPDPMITIAQFFLFQITVFINTYIVICSIFVDYDVERIIIFNISG